MSIDSKAAAIIKKILGTDKIKQTDEILLIAAMDELAQFEYEAFGFPYTMIAYSHSKKSWTVFARNPMTFSNPEIECQTPLEAINKFLESVSKHQIKDTKKSSQKVFNPPFTGINPVG